MTLVASSFARGEAQTVLGTTGVNMKQSCRLLTTVDSQGGVTAFPESRVMPHAVSPLISVDVNSLKVDYKFGYGFRLNL
jgi:hypothetical protein